MVQIITMKQILGLIYNTFAYTQKIDLRSIPQNRTFDIQPESDIHGSSRTSLIKCDDRFTVSSA